MWTYLTIADGKQVVLKYKKLVMDNIKTYTAGLRLDAP